MPILTLVLNVVLSQSPSGCRGHGHKLSDMETYGPADGFSQPFGRQPYALGHFATDLLIINGGRSSILRYWQALKTNLDRGLNQDAAWRAALESTFGISVVDFYAEYERYRGRGFR